MDRGQTYEVVDTPPPQDTCYWPSPEDFQELEETKRWREILPGTYKILDTFNRGRNSYGPSVVLKLKPKNGSTFFVWAPASLVFAMEKRKETNFILNLGAKLAEDTGNIFYDFRLC